MFYTPSVFGLMKEGDLREKKLSTESEIGRVCK